MIKSELKALYYKQKYIELNKHFESKIKKFEKILLKEYKIKEKTYNEEICKLKNEIRLLNIHTDYLEKEIKKLQD